MAEVHLPLMQLDAKSTISINITDKEDLKLKQPKLDDNASLQYGKFAWATGETYEGQFLNGRRHGKGKQTWKDGSHYEGDFFKDLRHGQGTLKWTSGEVYKGEFYKDHLHGAGNYYWPNGSKFSGRFYQSLKEGYGRFTFSNGDKFEGLYKQDERFGPGILSYKSEPNMQDMGIWYRHRLVRICSSAKDFFTMKDHDEYEYYPKDQRIKQPRTTISEKDCFMDEKFSKDIELYKFFPNDLKKSLGSESHTLPMGIESYCRDFHHLPRSKIHKLEWDEAFCSSADASLLPTLEVSIEDAVNPGSFSISIQEHINRHRDFQVTFEANRIMVAERSEFADSDPGRLEHFSLELIEAAGAGDASRVSAILETGLIDPNVCDVAGNFPLMSAAVNLHHDVVNLLLDHGANVNQLTDEGVACVNACMVYYYPIDHFLPNIAEGYVSNYRQVQAELAAKRNSTSSVASSSSSRRSDALRASVSSSSDRSSLAESQESVDTAPYKSDRRILKKYHKERFREEQLGGATLGSMCFKKQEPRVPSAPAPLTSISRSNSFVESATQELLNKRKLNRKWKDFGSTVNMVKLDYPMADELIEKTANLLSTNERAVRGMRCRDNEIMKQGTLQALAVWKAEHASMRKMIEVLLKRGASPNSSSYPYYPIFLAVKCGDAEMLKSLLEHGASTTVRLPQQCGGLTPLHIACAVECDGGGELVELLLQAGAAPNATAHDQHITRSVGRDKKMTDASLVDVSLPREASKLNALPWLTDKLKFVDDHGRTPLHVACDRDDDHELARRNIHLLLDNGANPNVLWSGHSPLSISAASGNDLAIDELIKFGADLSLPLTHSLGSLLCVAADPQHEDRRRSEDRIKLIDKLIDAGADILAPVVFGKAKSVGTAVDYVYWKQSEDARIFRTPYHALTKDERAVFNARKALLDHLAQHLRRAAVHRERERLRREMRDGCTPPE